MRLLLEAAHHNFQFHLSLDINLRIKDIKQQQLWGKENFSITNIHR